MNDEMQPIKPFEQIGQPVDDGPWVRKAQTLVILGLSNGREIRIMSDPVEITDQQAMELAYKRDTMAPKASLLEVSISNVLSRMPEKQWYATRALSAFQERMREVEKIRLVVDRARKRGTEGSRQIADWLDKLLAAWQA